MRKKYWILGIKIFILSSFSVFTVGAQEKNIETECAYSFVHHYISSSNQEETFCAKVFEEKVTWDVANAICKITYSYMTSTIHQNSSLHLELMKKGITLLWFGIRRRAHFFINESTSELFKEKASWGARWSLSTSRVNDCVTLNLITGTLLTQPCNSSLPFVCDDRGVPDTTRKEPLCPEKWDISYPLSKSGKKCVSLHDAHSYKDAEEVCEDYDSRLATSPEYNILHDSNSFLPRKTKAYWVKKENKDICMFKIISAANSNSTVERPRNCSNQLPFVCVKEYETEDVQVKISPDFVPSFPSSSTCTNNPYVFTCDIKINGRQVDGGKIPNTSFKPILYQWFKDDLPIAMKSYVLRVDYLGDSAKKNPSITNLATRQGSYHCEVRIMGSSKFYSSPKKDFFYLDIATYVITLDGIVSSAIPDYSEQDFGNFLTEFDHSIMNLLLKKLKYRNSFWDLGSIRLTDDVATMKVLLYIHRTDDDEFNDESAYEDVKKLFEEHRFSFFGDGSISVTVTSADVCFSKDAKSSDSCKNDVIWPTSTQTINALSEPTCLDGKKRLVRRKCKANLADKARWSPFSCSSCEIQQKKVRDMQSQCADGYSEFRNRNLCFKIYYERKNWYEARKTCSESSSYILNELHDGLVPRDTTVWISYKYYHGKIQQVGRLPKIRSFNLENIADKQKPEFHCISVALEKGKYTMQLRNCSEKFSFVCLKNPIEFVSSVKFSNNWIKVLDEEPCYYFSKDDGYKWKESKKECQSMFPNAHLLKEIHNLERYKYLKTLVHHLYNAPECDSLSWWIDLEYGEKFWRNGSVLSNWEYVDWHPYTNFDLKTAYGVLTLSSNNEISWTLADPSTKSSISHISPKFRYVCEIEKCVDNRPTQAYIEDRSMNEKIASTQNYSSSVMNFILKCIPSGWFLTDSIAWYKDEILLNTTSNEFFFPSHPLISLEEALIYEGYYSCSVDKVQPAERVFSSKVLFKIPGIHTYVLSLRSQNENYIRDCVDFMLLGEAFMHYENTYLHKCLKNNFKKTFSSAFHFLLKNITCNSIHTDVTLHIYYNEDNESEEGVLKKIQNTDFAQFSQECDLVPDSISVKSTVACQEEETVLINATLTWPKTRIGETAFPNKLCLTGEGALLERKCLGDFNTGATWAPVSSCACRTAESDVTQELYQWLHKDTPFSFSPSNPLTTLTISPEKLLPADVQLVAEILVHSVKQQTFEPQVLASVSKTVNDLMDAPQEILKKTANSSNQIIESFEHIAHNVETGNESLQVAFENLAIAVQPLATPSYDIPNCALLPNWSQNLTTFSNVSVSDFTSIVRGFEAGIVLPSALVFKMMKSDSDRVVYAVHKNINFVKNITVPAAVIHASFGDSSVYDVDPPVQMFFKINESIGGSNRSSLKCVFWDQRLNDNYGGWSYKGCLSNQLQNDLISCSCNHLTSFTVILDLNPKFVLQHIHKTALTLITYIGCSLSCFGLGVIIMTFLFFREWRKSMKNKALFNLSATLVCFLLLFMTGTDKTDSRNWCMVIAVILHYLLLSSFAWMLVSAFLMYLSLVKVLATYIPCLIQKAMLFAYGMPALIIIAVLSFKYQLYYQENYCWLSQDAFYPAIAFPVLAMLAANFIIFGLILHANTCGKSKSYLRTNQDRRKLTIARAKALFCISILLGLSWIFGFLAIGEAKTVFQYLFALTTTLQGFLCFIFFIVRQKFARQLWMTRLFPSSVEKMSRISHITGSTVSHRMHINTDVNNETLFRSVIFKAHSPYAPYI